MMLWLLFRLGNINLVNEDGGQAGFYNTHTSTSGNDIGFYNT